VSELSRLIVLGGTGFLGRVIGRHARAAGLEAELLGSRDADLSREGSLEAIRDRVDVHTALILASAVTRDVADDVASLNLNLEMARNVARFAARRPPCLLVYLSSVSVYGRSTSNLAITERTPVDLDSRYAKAKHGGEEILAGCGAALMVLRVCQVYGPTDTHVTYGPSRFIDGIRREGRLVLFGEGEERRDFLYEEDFGRLVVGMLRKRCAGTFNLATGQSRTFMELADALRRIVPTPFEVLRAPRKVAKVDQGFDIAALKDLFPGLSFTPLEQGLGETWEGGALRGKG
jgi:nucleoside-diphosphate-sugar epimerase